MEKFVWREAMFSSNLVPNIILLYLKYSVGVQQNTGTEVRPCFEGATNLHGAGHIISWGCVNCLKNFLNTEPVGLHGKCTTGDTTHTTNFQSVEHALQWTNAELSRLIHYLIDVD